MILSKPESARWSLALPGAIVMLLASWLYWPALQNDYVWDDWQLFVDHPAVISGDLSWDNVVRPIFAATSYVRPTVFGTFVLQSRLFDGEPFYSHLINYLAYLFNVGLVMLLAHAHFQRRSLKGIGLRVALAGLIYAVHPAQVETAAWSSGRFDLFATSFVLIALVTDLRVRQPLLRVSMIGVAFALALGSKELAVVLPALLLIQRIALEPSEGRSMFLQARETLRRERIAVLVCLVVVLAYLMIRVDVTSGRLVPATTVAESLDSVWAHAAYVLRTIQFYASLALAPLLGSTMPIHPALAELSLMPRQLALSVVGLGVLITIVVSAARRYYVGLMLLCALLSLLPVLNILVLSLWGNIGCDRFLTLPLVFVALAFAGASLPKSLLENRAVPAGLGLLILVWGVTAAANVRASVPLWRDDATLWHWMYSIPEHRTHVRLNYTSAMLKESKFAEVRAALEEALKEGPLNAIVQINYGYALAMTGDPTEGSNFIEGALSVFPRVESVTEAESLASRGAEAFVRDQIGYGYYALTEARLQLRDAAGALEAADKSIGYKPLTPQSHLAHSLAMHALGRNSESEASFSKALSLANPSFRATLEIRRASFARWWASGSDSALSY